MKAREGSLLKSGEALLDSAVGMGQGYAGAIGKEENSNRSGRGSKRSLSDQGIILP